MESLYQSDKIRLTLKKKRTHRTLIETGETRRESEREKNHSYNNFDKR